MCRKIFQITLISLIAFGIFSTVVIAQDQAPSVAPTIPGIPVPSLNPNQGTFTLNWTASSDTDGIAYYELQRSNDNGFTFTTIANPTTNSYSEIGLAPGTYLYRVRAVDGAGNKSAFSAILPRGIYALDNSQGTYRDAYIRDYDFVEGYSWRMGWADFETAEGVYDFSAIDYIISKLESIGKKLTIISLLDPDYIITAPGVTTWTYIDPVRGNPIVRAVPWDPYLLQRFRAFTKALGDHLVPVGGVPTPLRDHPVLANFHVGIPGLGPIREAGFEISNIPGYTRQNLLDAIKASLHAATDEFPNKCVSVGFWRVTDTVSSPELWEDIRVMILNEFDGVKNPKVGFFQDNLAASKDLDTGAITGYPNVDFARPLYLSKDSTHIMFQALTSWLNPFTGADKVANATPSDGIEYAYETYNAAYFELYVPDLDNPEYQPLLADWNSQCVNLSSVIVQAPVNNPPVAYDQGVSTDEDTPLAITLSATDPDGYSLTYSVVTQPANGTLSGTAPDLTYTPNANYNGADSFTFKANDGKADSNIATVSITINPVNDPPMLASIGNKAINENEKLEFTVSATDIDGDTLIYAATNLPTGATFDPATRIFSWTPAYDQQGTYQITFTVDDGRGGVDSETITITVNNVSLGLAADYKFDEGAGNIAKDSSGNGNDASLTDVAGWDPPLWSSDNPVSGYCLQFQDATDAVKLPNSVLNGLVNLTFEAWIRTQDTNAAIISGATAGIGGNQFTLYINKKDQVTLFVKEHSVIIDLPNLTDGNWHYLVWTRDGIGDGTNGINKIFMDGVLRGSAMLSTGALIIDPNGLWLGQEQDSVGGGWDLNQAFLGFMDEVKIRSDIDYSGKGTCGNGIWDIGEDINNCPSDANEYSLGPTEAPQKIKDEYEIGMYIYPGWHNFPGTGIYNLYEKWKPVITATAVVAGQDRPTVPLLNYYDDSNPVAADWMIKWGVENGVDFFVYDWYYYNAGIKANKALEEGFLKSKYVDSAKFAIMWANHSEVTKETAYAAADYVINNYFSHPGYYKVGGKPLFMVWDLRALIDGLGRIDKDSVDREKGKAETIALFDYFRSQSLAKGYGGAFIILVKSAYLEQTPGFSFADMKAVGVDGLTDYTYLLQGMAANSTRDYSQAITVNENTWEEYYQKMTDLYGANPYYFPVIAPGYDDYCIRSPEAGGKGSKIVTNSTPEKFQQLAQDARNFVESKNINPKIIMVEAWSEWSEGAIMAPTQKWGTAYLQALAGKFDNQPPTAPANLKATTVSSAQIDLSWNASTDNIGVTGYRIYRDGSRVGTSATTAYSDTGLSAGATYTYYVTAYDAAGNESERSNSVSVGLRPTDFAADLSRVKAYPNPYRGDKHSQIIFDNLTVNVRIRIYTLTGELVREIREQDGDRAYWDVRNKDGERVSSGIYIYHITNSKGEEKKGKVAVIK